MGNSSSKPEPQQSPVLNEKTTYESRESDDSDVTRILNNLKLQDHSQFRASIVENGNIASDDLDVWESDFLDDPRYTLAQGAFRKNEMYSIISNPSSKSAVQHQYLFNTEIKTIGSPKYLDNQRSSGRCWLFATSNVLRQSVIKNYNLNPEKFQVSQAYLFFYDKLERANYALDNIIDTADQDLESGIVNFILKDPIGDGGQWDMAVNIVDKYGIVPNEFFPENAQALSSLSLNYVLKETIREYALALRELKNSKAPSVILHSVKKAFIKQIYNTISIFLGTPPKPTDKFTWEFIDANGKFGSFETTPLDFYKDHVRYQANKHFSLIHDPRNDTGKLYTVDRLNNFSGGRKIQYVNTSLDALKEAAIKMIKADVPVFFGCDVGKYYDRQTGILDIDQYKFELAFGYKFKASKKERLQTGSSAMTHAMVLTGVHLDKDGKPVRWKIENSWGSDVGDQGYFVMTDKWFDEFVFQVVSSKAYVSKEDYNVWKAQDYVVLPYYDPMGALA